jgi:hypothetical protein
VGQTSAPSDPSIEDLLTGKTLHPSTVQASVTIKHAPKVAPKAAKQPRIFGGEDDREGDRTSAKLARERHEHSDSRPADSSADSRSTTYAKTESEPKAETKAGDAAP